MIALTAATAPVAGSATSTVSRTPPRARKALMTTPLREFTPQRSTCDVTPGGASDQLLARDLARALVRIDLALDPLERVVDRLRVAAEVLGHVLVGRALEVEPERVRLERREPASEAEDKALQLFGRDHA